MTAATPDAGNLVPVAPDLAVIEARGKAASRAPWRQQSGFRNLFTCSNGATGLTICLATFTAEQSSEAQADADLDFTAHAREDIPALLGLVARLTAERDALEGANEDCLRLGLELAAVRAERDALQSLADARHALGEQTRAERDAAVKALEWALDHAGTEHPHYPSRDGDQWSFPYLVHGSPMGGGVGNANYPTALEAVQAALTRTAGADHE